jgi:hypothetical protein
LVARIGEDVNLVLISDHGFGPGNVEYPVPPKSLDVISGSHRADGIFLAAGPDIARGEIEGLTTMEVAPILLALTGLPISEELPGRLEPSVFRPGYFDDRPVTHVRRWDIDWKTANTPDVPTEAIDESMEALRALGYIGDDVEGGGTDAIAVLDFWKIGQMFREASLVGELSYDVMRGNAEHASGLMELVRRYDPRTAKLLPWKVRDALRRMEESVDAAPGTLALPETLARAGLAE